MERLIITLIIVGVLALLWLVWQLYKTRLMQSIDSAGEVAGKPVLLYFTGEYCTVCKFQQAPIVEKLAQKFAGTIAVQKVDVSAQPELAGRYKVLTLPTTVVLTPQGQVAHINYGVAPQSKLEAQLLF